VTAASPGRLAGRLALVTGASRGLGAAAALAFAREGAHCVLVARTVGGLEELDDRIKAEGGSATLVPLDVTDGPGIDRLGAALYERFGRLDVLLGNAAILGVLSPIGHIDPAVFEQVMAVNVTANWRLIRSLDPLLRTPPCASTSTIQARCGPRCAPRPSRASHPSSRSRPRRMPKG
jgi:NAD(P)-dependent dehydrogenase (short-subunit alcohol dehydrogenase family)